jgi:hypothetical protein
MNAESWKVPTSSGSAAAVRPKASIVYDLQGGRFGAVGDDHIGAASCSARAVLRPRPRLPPVAGRSCCQLKAYVLHRNHHAAIPPSTLTSMTVTKELSSDARISATLRLPQACRVGNRILPSM